MPTFDADTLRMLMPLVVTVAAGCVLLMWGAFTRRLGRSATALLLLVHAALFVLVAQLWNRGGYPILGGALVVDRFGLFFFGVCVACSLGTVLLSPGYLDRFNIARAEYYALLLFSLAGMFVLVTGNDLLAIFLGLELMSLAVYVAVGYRRRDVLANEAALKYFLLGAFAAAFFLFGMSILYGLTGSFSLRVIAAEAVGGGLVDQGAFRLAVALLLVGFAFKVSAVPFHMWVPDVYQGAPSPVTAFMASAVKAAGFGALLRVLLVALPSARAHWAEIVGVLAVATMTVGNLTALVQRNVKRMLAFSSIAHAGYILVALAAVGIDNPRPAAAVMFYLAAYAVMTMGAFAGVAMIERRTGSRGLELEDYAGLGWRWPLIGATLTVTMLGMAGIPGTAGFFAKYYAFGAAVERGLVALAVVGVLNSALSLYYYLRVIVYLYMRRPVEDVPVRPAWGMLAVLIAGLVLTIWYGLGPGGLLPGIEDLAAWTTDSVTRLAQLR